jgi:Na+/H+-dicarboxylate symporter
MFLDMGRSATNAVGNSIAAAVVAKWEGQLGNSRDDDGAGGGGVTEVKVHETSASA